MNHVTGESAATAARSVVPDWATIANWTATGVLVVAAIWWLVRATTESGHRSHRSLHALMCAAMAGSFVAIHPGL